MQNINYRGIIATAVLDSARLLGWIERGTRGERYKNHKLICSYRNTDYKLCQNIKVDSLLYRGGADD